MGRIIPYIMENKKCLKPPTRIIFYDGLFVEYFELVRQQKSLKSTDFWRPKSRLRYTRNASTPLITHLIILGMVAKSCTTKRMVETLWIVGQTTYQLVQDFATIHRISSHSHNPMAPYLRRPTGSCSWLTLCRMAFQLWILGYPLGVPYWMIVDDFGWFYISLNYNDFFGYLI